MGYLESGKEMERMKNIMRGSSGSDCSYGEANTSHFNKQNPCKKEYCPVNRIKRMHENFFKGLSNIKEELSDFEKDLRNYPNRWCCYGHGSATSSTYETCRHRNVCP